MQSIHSLSLPPLPLSPPTNTHTKRRSPVATNARKRIGSGGGGDFGGSLVDSDMVVLRRRLHELKLTQNDHRPTPPPHWTEWEKRWWMTSHCSEACAAAGVLQTAIMNVRPAVAVGALMLVSVSVPVAAVSAASGLAAAVVSGLHHLG
ncbi:hypothetical protein QJS04_geneDACA002985 [Acorus gramineus]|uniref:Uncharacterized protein n=1 Tax=Acorus gramineus TaxID=55184 RepID=A0AAV9BVS6_ACOGR|nr:hypothetical protein QJS04_geneDACA002985 [Acorus gramineus]